MMLKLLAVPLTIETQFRFGVDLQSNRLDRFVASHAQTVAAFFHSSENLFDLSNFLSIPCSQFVQETYPVLISGFVDPFGIFFDFSTLSFEMA